MLVAVLQRYSKVSWGACSLISHLQVLSILFAWINWLRFGETLIAFDFDEKLKQSVAQVTM